MTTRSPSNSVRPVDTIVPLLAGSTVAVLALWIGSGAAAIETLAAFLLGVGLRRFPFRIGILLVCPTAGPAVIFAATKSVVLLALTLTAALAAALFMSLVALAGHILAEGRNAA